MSPKKETNDDLTPSSARSEATSGGGSSQSTESPARDSSEGKVKTEKTGEMKGQQTAPEAAKPANYKWVGARVRSMYDSVLHEPIPEGFMDLLRQAYDGKKPPDKS
jgi:hypothetical protein